jgi:hypothetical protein
MVCAAIDGASMTSHQLGHAHLVLLSQTSTVRAMSLLHRCSLMLLLAEQCLLFQGPGMLQHSHDLFVSCFS